MHSYISYHIDCKTTNVCVRLILRISRSTINRKHSSRKNLYLGEITHDYIFTAIKSQTFVAQILLLLQKRKHK